MTALAVAQQWLVTGKPDRALATLDAAGEQALTPWGLWLRARALIAEDRHDEARRVAERGLSADPTATELWSALSDALRGLDDLAGAERSLLSALRLEPSSALLLADYARLLAEAGQADKADRVLARAAELEPGSAEVARTRAYLALARGDDRAAVRAARTALERDPESLAAHALLGSAASLTGDVTAAHRHTRTAAAGRLGDADMREVAREARLAAHWSMWPLRPVARYGPVTCWAVGVSLMFLGVALLPSGLDLLPVLAYFLFVVYTWTAPPLLRAWARWRW